ncbi:MAG: PPC domain-containing DNA-binding protein [Gemmataceae bacterium]
MSADGTPLRALAVRLNPGDDLRQGLFAFARAAGVRAGAVVTCVGSLTAARLRLAGRSEPTELAGPFEIVSLVGTLDPAGGHLHVCLADRDGKTVGGHLLDGCPVFTTAEVVIAELTGLAFGREPDPVTGYRELVVRPRCAAGGPDRTAAKPSSGVG